METILWLIMVTLWVYTTVVYFKRCKGNLELTAWIIAVAMWVLFIIGVSM